MIDGWAGVQRCIIGDRAAGGEGGAVYTKDRLQPLSFSLCVLGVVNLVF